MFSEMADWWTQPYPKGVAVGPAKMPRIYYPPSHDKGTFIGPGVLAMKRAISRAQRWEPWAPEVWDKAYGEKFAMGRGTGRVADSGMRGFQRQEGIYEDGVLGDETYQRMRRCKVPAGNPHAGEHIFDAECVRLLAQEVKAFGPEAIAEARFQKLLGAMKMLSDHTPGYLLGGGHGIPLSEVSPYQRLDCSSSTSKALYEAGMFGMGQYAIVSGEFNGWGKAGTGKYFTIYCNAGHVFIRLHKSQWWRFDTSPHGDGGRGPKLRYLPRFTGGFAARHWEGM
jgi:hypothetical protein